MLFPGRFASVKCRTRKLGPNFVMRQWSIEILLLDVNWFLTFCEFTQVRKKTNTDKFDKILDEAFWRFFLSKQAKCNIQDYIYYTVSPTNAHERFSPRKEVRMVKRLHQLKTSPI